MAASVEEGDEDLDSSGSQGRGSVPCLHPWPWKRQWQRAGLRLLS